MAIQLYLAKYLLPVSSEPLENGALAVDGDRIRDCGPAEKLTAKYAQAEKIDLGDAVMMPGLINAHCHLELGKSPPYDLSVYTEPSGEPNFIRWLIRLSQYQDDLKPQEKRAAIQEGLKTLLRSGVTAVGDLTTYEGAMACYEESGLRVVTYPEVMNLNRKLSQERFESALAFIDEAVSKTRPKVKVGLAPFAPYTLSKNLLKIFYQHIKQLAIPLQIHTSESFAEMEFFYDSKGDIANHLFPHVGWGESLPPPHQKTPIQYLNSIEFLEVKPALVGCVHLGPTDLSLIAHSGSTVVYCPRANETLRLGKAPLRKILSHKIPVAFGSESLACNQSLSLWEEMRSALELNSQDPEPLTAEEALRMATLGGACSLSWQKDLGSLEKGKYADFLAVHAPQGSTLQTITAQVVKHGGPDSILKKFVGGEPV
ncbi:MAG: amidohydrolase family protein [bacterium]